MQNKLPVWKLGNQSTPNNSCSLLLQEEKSECVSGFLCFVWETESTQHSLTWDLILGVLDVTAVP